MNPDWQETTHLVVYEISVAKHLNLCCDFWEKNPASELQVQCSVQPLAMLPLYVYIDRPP